MEPCPEERVLKIDPWYGSAAFRRFDVSGNLDDHAA
jgi:hypothetical protein